MESWLYLFLGLLFLCLSAFYSAAETSFQKLNRFRMEVEAEDGKRTAKQVVWLYKRNDSTLVTILIGNNLVNVFLSVLFTNLFLRYIPMPEAINSLISSIILTIIVYLFGETIPKQMASKIPNLIAKIVAYPVTIFYYLLFPLSMFFKGLNLLFTKVFKSKKATDMTEEDFNTIIENNEKGGLLEKNESDLIQASFDFSDTSVKEVLTPREKMFEIDLKGLTNVGLVKIICGTKFSRIPVYFGNRDKIVGILLVKKYLSAYLENPQVNFLDFVEKPYIVSPSIKIDDLVDGFRKKKTQVALVLKDGKLLGMVTMEDVLEELVGPIGERYNVPREVRP